MSRDKHRVKDRKLSHPLHSSSGIECLVRRDKITSDNFKDTPAIITFIGQRLREWGEGVFGFTGNFRCDKDKTLKTCGW